MLDARRLLGCRERRGNEIHDIADEGGREQRDLELVDIATVGEDVGLAHGDLLEARRDGDGRVAMLACESERRVVVDHRANGRLLRLATGDDLVELRDVLDVVHVEQ